MNRSLFLFLCHLNVIQSDSYQLQERNLNVSDQGYQICGPWTKTNPPEGPIQEDEDEEDEFAKSENYIEGTGNIILKIR